MFTPTKGAMSPLRCSLRAGLPFNPFPHSIDHLGGLSTHQLLSTKDGVIQIFPGAHTREDAHGQCRTIKEQAPRVKNANQENGDASSTLKRTWVLTLCQELKLTQELSSHSSPCLDSLKDQHLEGVERGFGSLRKCLGRAKSAAPTEESEGVFIGPPQKIAATVLFMCSSELPTQGQNF